jgi:hypothetical protein
MSRVRKTYAILRDYPDSNSIPQQIIPNKIIPEQHNDSCLMWDNLPEKDTVDPAKWGPGFWYMLHNAASHYPETASPICASKIKGFILGIPYMLPCKSCTNDAMMYIDSKSASLDDICSSRAKLFDFFHDFHNFVNTKTRKKEFPKDAAIKLYNM